MIQEFAIDPDAIENFGDLRFILEAFGLCKGRVISELPEDWATQVHRRIATTGRLDDIRVAEALVRIKDGIARHRRVESRPFLAMAKAEHKRFPFHAILTVDQRARELRMVPFLDIEKSELWTDPRSFRWVRSAGNIFRFLPLFAALTKVLHVVDPYMDLRQDKCRSFMQELIALVHQERGSDSKHIVVHIHISDRHAHESFDERTWSECLASLPGRWSPMEMHVHRWPSGSQKTRMHNRYLLNDRGGLQFGDGLEFTDRDDEDTVHVLGLEPYKALLAHLEHDRPVRTVVLRA